MNTRYLAAVTLAATILLALAACSGAGPGAGPDDPFDGTSWVLIWYGENSLLPGREITATFEDGQVSGSAGCNTYGGTYQVRGDSISVSDLFATEMACLEPEGIMEQEQTYLEFLADAQSFDRHSGRMLIFRSDGEALTFLPAE